MRHYNVNNEMSVTSKLQNCEKEILIDILRICEKHQLRVYMMYGTLLGAVRHGGFIPWDDDLDVAMPRVDYDLFKEYAKKELPDNIKIRDATDNVHNGCWFMKIHNVNTAAVHAYTKDKDRYTGVFVDIFPLDGCPEEESERNKHVRKVHLWMKLNHKLRFGFDRAHSWKGKIAYLFMIPLKKVLPYDFFYKKYEKEVKKYKFDEEKLCVADWFSSLEHRFMKTSDFRTAEQKSFEDIFVPVPMGYINVLETLYGNWKKLPPEEKRVGTHDFVILDFEKSYLDYC